jgi:hypothetical protein
VTTIAEAVKAEGLVLKANTDGEFQPYAGDYIVTWKSLRKETSKSGNVYWAAEWDITESLGDGMQKRNTKFADFKQPYFFDLNGDGTDEGQKKNLKKLLGDAFTFGVELDYSTDELLEHSAQDLIGKEGYIHAYAKKAMRKEGDAWVEDVDKPAKQGISIRKLSQAQKRWPNGGVKF